MQYNHAVKPIMSSRRPIIGLLVFITLVTYAGAFRGDFQFDDYSTILENPRYVSWSTFAEHLHHTIRPLLSLTFLIDHMLYGSSPAGYHVLNLLLHVGCGLLIYSLLRRAVPDELHWAPLWTTLVFLVHPLATETVTYISCRASGLMTFWYLAALFLYTKYLARTSGRTGIWSSQGGAVLCFLCALASKETAMTFPVALLLWDLFISRLRGQALWSQICFEHLPFWLVLGVAGIVALAHPRYQELLQFSFDLRPFWENVLTQVHAMWSALALYLTPWNQNFDHDLPLVHGLMDGPVLVEIFSLAVLIGGIIVLSNREPLVSFGLAWFLLQWLPLLIIPRIDLLSERNLYLGSFGLVLAVVVATLRLAQKLAASSPQLKHFPISVRIAAVGAVIVLCSLTFQRNILYHDPVLLWSDAVTKSPLKARPHNNLGHALAVNGEWDQAIEEFRTAVTLDPNYALAHDNLRQAYLHRVGRR